MSLTFVIDHTGSMWDDIHAVQKGADQLLTKNLEKKSSDIENLVLVTVNDPGKCFYVFYFVVSLK